jgi:hypothetical protein
VALRLRWRKIGHDTRSLQAYLGHRNIQNTTRYTALAQDRFKGFWNDYWQLRIDRERHRLPAAATWANR